MDLEQEVTDALKLRGVGEATEELVDTSLAAAIAPLRNNGPFTPDPANSVPYAPRYGEPQLHQYLSDTMQRFFKHHEGREDHGDVLEFYRHLNQSISPFPRDEFTVHNLAKINTAARLRHEKKMDVPYDFIATHLKFAKQVDKRVNFKPILQFMNRSLVSHPPSHRRAAFALQRALMEQHYKPGGAGYFQAKQHFEDLLEGQQRKRAKK